MEAEKLNGTGTDGFKGKLALLQRGLAGSLGVMVVASTVAGVLGYLYDIIMNRLLPKAAFGDLYVLTSIFIIVTVAYASVQLVVAKYVAQFEAKGELDNSRSLMRSYLRWLTVACIGIIVLSAALAWPAAWLLKLQSPLLILIMGVTMATGLFVVLANGALQGQQRYVAYGGTYVGASALKILAGVSLVSLGLGIYGAMLSGTVSALVLLAVLLFFVRDLLAKPAANHNQFRPAQTVKFFLPAAVAVFLFVFMTQVDVVLVKVLFSKSLAGDYSYAALAGKAILFLPEGVMLVLFPRVANLKARNESTRSTLWWSLLVSSVMLAAAVAFYAIFPAFTAWLFVGGKGRSITGLVALFGLAMAVFATVKLLMFYHLAMERTVIVVFLAVATVLETAGIMLLHNNARQVVLIVLAVGIALLAVSILLIFTGNAEPRADSGSVPGES